MPPETTIASAVKDWLDLLQARSAADESSAATPQGFMARFRAFVGTTHKSAADRKIDRAEERIASRLARSDFKTSSSRDRATRLLAADDVARDVQEIERIDRQDVLWEHAPELTRLAYRYREQLDLTRGLLALADEYEDLDDAAAHSEGPTTSSIPKRIRETRTALGTVLELCLTKLPPIHASDTTGQPVGAAEPVMPTQGDAPPPITEPASLVQTYRTALAIRVKLTSETLEKLGTAWAKLDGSTLSVIRYLSSESGAEVPSLALVAVAVAGAAYSFPYYRTLGMKPWNYWVVQDYVDSGVLAIACMTLLLLGMARLIKISQRRLFNEILQKQVPTISGITLLARWRPTSVLLATLVVSLLITALIGWFDGVNQLNRFNNEGPTDVIATNDGRLLKNVQLVGTSARTAFFLVPPKPIPSNDMGSTTADAETATVERPLADTSADKVPWPVARVLALDRAQVLCHSADDTCEMWLAADRDAKKDKPESPQPHHVWLTISANKGPVATPNFSSFLKATFDCTTTSPIPLHSFYFDSDKADPCMNKVTEATPCDEPTAESLDGGDLDGVAHLLILGRASNAGSVLENMQLGKARAESAEKLLRAMNVDVDMSTETLGDLLGGRSIYDRSDQDDPEERRVDVFACLS